MQNNDKLDKDDFDKFNPNSMIIPQVNYVNINNKQRKLIVMNYGNFHDKFVQKQHEKPMKLNKNKNQNKNDKYYQNQNHINIITIKTKSK